MNSTQEFLFYDNEDYEIVTFKQVDFCLCTPTRPIHGNCKSHKNPECPYSCAYELPVGDGFMFLIILTLFYALWKN